MAAVLTVALVGSALFAWFSLFWLVPENVRGMFRYRLWALRDELAEEIHEGNFERTDEPRRVVEAMECFIECAEELTPLRISMLMLAVRPWRPERQEGRKDPALSLRGLPAADKSLLGAYIERFNKLVTHQVFLGSPSGWLLGAFLYPLVQILRFYSRTVNKRESAVAYDVRRRTTEASLSALAASHAEEIHHHEPLSTFGN